MNNPINTAQKIKEGCKKEFQHMDCGNYYIQKDYNVCLALKSMIGSFLYLCPICQATLTAKKEEWQNEIEFLEDLINNNMKGDLDGNESPEIKKIFNRLELLKQAVEIAK